jgi:hypothetical protein
VKHIELTKGLKCKVDDEDYEWLSKMSWHAGWQGNRFYAGTGIYNASTKKTSNVRMHVLIMQPDTDKVVDHINNDSLDNRRCNLRITTQSENLSYKKGYGKSKQKYVYYRKDRKSPWYVKEYNRVTKKSTEHGCFATEEEAIKKAKEVINRRCEEE